MHVHVTYDGDMRTTIELSDEQRAQLLEAAARRGEKGFSSIVQEALTLYFESQEQREAAVLKALATFGTIAESDADRLEKDVRRLRRSWR